jgi:serine/threonine protein phosphatase 1
MRLLAIGDIHGCLLQFNDLLNLVKPQSGDHVVLLGDYVDRGPDSRGVLDRILELKRSGMNLVCLRGNHEIMMLGARNGEVDLKTWLGTGGTQTLGSYGSSPGRSGSLADVPDEHWQFLSDELHDYFEADERIFVHAGVLPALAMSAQVRDWLCWEKLRDDMRHSSGKTIICGHTAQKSGEIKLVPGAACIDTYAYGGGWLTCLDALSGRFWQVNFMGKPREGRVDFI